MHFLFIIVLIIINYFCQVSINYIKFIILNHNYIYISILYILKIQYNTKIQLKLLWLTIYTNLTQILKLVSEILNKDYKIMYIFLYDIYV